jgi:type I restriction enzyme S subunit
VSTGFAVLRPTSELGPSAIAAIADEPPFADYLSAVSEGSAYPAVSPEAMAAYPVSLPSPEDLERFEQDTMVLRRRAARAEAESVTLASLRDALLPEVLSGRLRVPAAEDLVEAAM